MSEGAGVTAQVAELVTLGVQFVEALAAYDAAIALAAAASRQARPG